MFVFFQWEINQSELSLILRFSTGYWEAYQSEMCTGKVPVGPLSFHLWCSNFVQTQQLLEWWMIAGMWELSHMFCFLDGEQVEEKLNCIL